MLDGYNSSEIEIPTIIGTQDSISEWGAMRNYHIQLGGKKENLLTYEAEYDIPQERYQEKMKKFFRKNLLE